MHVKKEVVQTPAIKTVGEICPAALLKLTALAELCRAAYLGFQKI